VGEEEDFLATVSKNFTRYFRPLIPCINRLRKVVFPAGRRWKIENENLYSEMKAVLREAIDGLRARDKGAGRTFEAAPGGAGKARDLKG
jgi:hypothetical protein